MKKIIQVGKVKIEWESYMVKLSLTIGDETLLMNGDQAFEFQEVCKMFAEAKLVD